MGRRYRGSLLLPLILIAGGVLLLLDNFGALDLDLWQIAARFWPVLLIAVGIDLVVRRSSIGRALSSVLIALAVLFAAFVAFYFFAPTEWTLREQAVRVDLRGATSAEAVVACSACSIELAAGASAGVLIDGVVVTSRASQLTQRTSRAEDELTYELVESGWTWLPRWSERSGEPVWRLSASPDASLDLSLEAEGRIAADLAGLSVTSVELRSTEGESRLVLSSTSPATYRVSVPRLELVVPSELGLRVGSAAAVAEPFPAGFVQTGSAIVSTNWATAPVRATVLPGPGTSAITIVSPRAGEPVPPSET